MHLPLPPLPPTPEPAAISRTVVREDVLWNRPVFKAPPLEPLLKGFDASVFAEELRRLGPGLR
jgi:hypothetical protein